MASIIMFGVMVWAFVNGFWGVGVILAFTIVVLEYQLWTIKVGIEEIQKEVDKL